MREMRVFSGTHRVGRAKSFSMRQPGGDLALPGRSFRKGDHAVSSWLRTQFLISLDRNQTGQLPSIARLVAISVWGRGGRKTARKGPSQRRPRRPLTSHEGVTSERAESSRELRVCHSSSWMLPQRHKLVFKTSPPTPITTTKFLLPLGWLCGASLSPHPVKQPSAPPFPSTQC